MIWPDTRNGLSGDFFDDLAERMRLMILLAVCALNVACSGPGVGPDDQLRAWLGEMELAAEEKDRRAMLNRISEAYVDARGNSRKDIGDQLLLQFMRQQNVTVVSTIDDIFVSGGTAAKMSVTVAMAGTDTGRFALSADAYKFDLELEKPDNEWLLIGAKWGELGKDVR